MATATEALPPLRLGTTLPAPGFGTWRCDPALIEPAIQSAIACGYRHFDLSPIYGNEAAIGRALAAACAAPGGPTRSDLFLASKLPPTHMAPEHVRPALEETLAALGVSYLDGYYVHWVLAYTHGCPFPVPDEHRLGYSPSRLAATWAALESCVDAGLVRRLGLSNTSIAKTEALLSGGVRHPPSLMQVEAHPYGARRKMVEWCAARGIIVCGYSPLFSPSKPATYADPDAPGPLLSHPVLVRLAQARGTTPAAVALRWAVQRGTCPLPKSTDPARMAENWAACNDTPPLSAEEMGEVDGMDVGWRYNKGQNMLRAGEDWRGVWDGDD